MAQQAKRSKKSADGVNFIITLISVSLVFIFLGYIMGQYAVEYVGRGSNASINQSNEVQSEIESRLNNLAEKTPVDTGESVPAATPGRQAAEPAENADSSLFRVQVGAFSQRANAERIQEKLKDAGYQSLITDGPPYRVQTGAFSSQDNAQRYADELKAKGYEVTIVR